MRLRFTGDLNEYRDELVVDDVSYDFGEMTEAFEEGERLTITIETAQEASERRAAIEELVSLADRYHDAAVAYTLDRSFKRGTELDSLGALLNAAIERVRKAGT